MLSKVKVIFTRLLDRHKIMVRPDDVLNIKISCDRGDSFLPLWGFVLTQDTFENYNFLFQFFILRPEDQLNMYYALQDSLKQRGILS